jgi:hypothetical protein
MTFRTCSWEQEVSRALKDGHWPEGCARELHDHVEACANCSDLVLVTQTFHQARSESEREAPVGSPGLLWWRAQLRRRNAAAERVSRPITIAEFITLAVYLLVAVVFIASQYRHGLRWAFWLPELAPSRFLHLWAIESANWNLPLLIFGCGVLGLLSGVVVYLASEKS